MENPLELSNKQKKQIMKTIIKQNQALNVMAQIMGMPAANLSNRILHRLQKQNVKFKNDHKERSIEYYAILQKLDVSDLMEKLFFQDEITTEVMELAKSIKTVQVREISIFDVQKKIVGFPTWNAILERDGVDGRLYNTAFEVDHSGLFINFTCTIVQDIKVTKGSYEQPDESEIEMEHIEIETMEIYDGEELIEMTDDIFNLVSQKLIENIIIE
tara:strand:- start:15509 stop:16153 length:645 start_codon:yes stop_codon:yes gene_type:complete